MKTRFFWAGGLGIFAFCLLFSCFDHLQANRSWILFNPYKHSQVFYTFNSAIMTCDFELQSGAPIFQLDRYSLLESLRDLATNDKNFWLPQKPGPSMDKDCIYSDLGQEPAFFCVGTNYRARTLLKLDWTENGFLRDNYKKSENKVFVTQKADVFGVIDGQKDVLLVTIKSKEKVFELNMGKHGISFADLGSIDITDDGSVVAMIFYKGGGLWIWRPFESDLYNVNSGLGGDNFGSFSISNDGKYLCTSFGHGVELWNIQERRFEKIFRWDKNIKDFVAYTCPPKYEGWVFDRNIYYRTEPDFFFNTKPNFWGCVNKVVFSSNSKRIYMLTRLKGYFGELSEWSLKVYDVDLSKFVTSKDVCLKTFPRNIAVSPNETYFVVLCNDGDILNIPLI